MAHADATVRSIFSLATSMTESCRRASKNGLRGSCCIVFLFLFCMNFNVCVRDQSRGRI